MIISFSVFREKIESCDKLQTIRKYSPGQYKKFLNCWKKRETAGRYNLFWHNPRNGGVRIRDAVPDIRPTIIEFIPADDGREHGIALSMDDWAALFPDNSMTDKEKLDDLARKDGFSDFDEMIAWFEKEHGPALYQEKFMVIRWLP